MIVYIIKWIWIKVFWFIRFPYEFEPSLNYDENPESRHLTDLYTTEYEVTDPANYKRFLFVDHNARDQFNQFNQPRQNEQDLVSFIDTSENYIVNVIYPIISFENTYTM